MEQTKQAVPVKVYRSRQRLTIAAPMPGLEPQDILVTVDEQGMMLLYGKARGHLKGENKVLIDEWNPGPYHKSLHLPDSVDATMANMTYENGVLVVAFPLSQQLRPATVQLERLSSTEGKRFGNSGRPPRRSALPAHPTEPSASRR